MYKLLSIIVIIALALRVIALEITLDVMAKWAKSKGIGPPTEEDVKWIDRCLKKEVRKAFLRNEFT